jgi:hypothetical protein
MRSVSRPGSRAGRGAFTVRLPGGSPLPGPNVLKLKSNSPFRRDVSKFLRERVTNACVMYMDPFYDPFYI